MLSVMTLEAVERFVEQQDDEEIYAYSLDFLKQKRRFAEQLANKKW